MKYTKFDFNLWVKSSVVLRAQRVFTGHGNRTAVEILIGYEDFYENVGTFFIFRTNPAIEEYIMSDPVIFYYYYYF